VSVNRSVVERLRMQFFADFHQILHAAQKIVEKFPVCRLTELGKSELGKKETCAKHNIAPFTTGDLINTQTTPPLGHNLSRRA